ncbi:DUF4864 domain-containing protein [candidate division WOR-3 bacterium]|nr:DUF4864 domain-containing protein [candidate division WOR-3 bacterium]
MAKKTILLIGSIVVTVSALSCCGMLNAPKEVVNEHLKAWADKDYEKAYALHAPTLNEELSLEQFKTHVDDYRIMSFNLTSVSVSGENASAEIKGTVILESGEKWGCRYRLIQRGDEWRIIGYDISPGALFEDEEEGD